MPLFRFGTTELIIILIIVILLFGDRIGKIAGELGSGIKAFRKGISPRLKKKGPETEEENE